jgi:cyclic pyranopterin phosphate synthase
MSQKPVKQDTLIDRFGRRVTYLRISVTDRCDLRCAYCMSEDMTFVPRAQILSLEEQAFVASAFVELGVEKIRITGGEPLVRRNVMQLIRELGSLAGLRELVMTTNGTQLARHAQDLQEAGVRRINLSLDSLRPERFRRITRFGDLERVMAGLRAAQAAGFEAIKLNAVVLKHYNHDEVCDLVRFAVDEGLDISFIEEMPLGLIGEHDRALAYYSSDEVRQDVERVFELDPTTDSTGGPSRYFRVRGTATRVGFISPHSHNFCASCNRVRLTAEGRLLLCLGQEHSKDLRHVVRGNPGNLEVLKAAIVAAMDIKPEGHDFDLGARPVILRHMSVTGG